MEFLAWLRSVSKMELPLADVCFIPVEYVPQGRDLQTAEAGVFSGVAMGSTGQEAGLYSTFGLKPVSTSLNITEYMFIEMAVKMRRETRIFQGVSNPPDGQFHPPGPLPFPAQPRRNIDHRLTIYDTTLGFGDENLIIPCPLRINLPILVDVKLNGPQNQ